MRQHTAVIALFLFGGVFVLGLLALASMLGPGVSQADDATMHNCPQPSRWAVAVWGGDDGTDADQAFATCGEDAVVAAYDLDPQTQGWSRWFADQPDISTLSTLDKWQGVIALGGAEAPVTPTPTLSPSPTPTTVATPSPTPTPVTQSFSGQGDQAISSIQLDGGLTIVTLTHTGSSNFIVWLRDSTGEDVDLLANEIGSYDGSMALGIEVAGNYALDITADGAWTVEIEQMKPTSAPGVPQTFTGTGPKASPLFWLDKTLTTFEMNHDGSSNFIVWLLNNNGHKVDLLVNKIGSYDGSTAIGLPAAGVHILDIEADGNWTISVQQ